LDDPIVDGDFFPRILADLFVVASISMQGKPSLFKRMDKK
jgi:hypothetical protein